jgi:uncharacterized protein YaeQ
LSHLTRRPASDRDVYAWWWPAAEAHPHDRDARIQHRLIATYIGHARQRIAYAQRGLADCRRVIHRLDREWL